LPFSEQYLPHFMSWSYQNLSVSAERTRS